MKKIFKIFIALLLLPFAFIYGVIRVLLLNRRYFRNLVLQRHLTRQAQIYRKNYNSFQMELVKDEN